MIVKPELINKVRYYFGLNIYEAKAWLALLSRGAASAGEIAQISSVPRSRTYDVLESLEKQGFVIQKLDKPVRYLAVKPDVVIEKLKNKVAIDADERTQILSKFNNSLDYKDLEMLHVHGVQTVNLEDLSTIVKGKSNVQYQMKSMLNSAQKEVLFVTTPAALKQEMKFLSSMLEKLDSKGVDVKFGINAKPEEIKQIEKDLKAKIIPTNLNSRFMIVDGKQLLTMLSDKHDEEMGVWLNSEFVANSLTDLFHASLNRK